MRHFNQHGANDVIRCRRDPFLHFEVVMSRVWYSQNLRLGSKARRVQIGGQKGVCLKFRLEFRWQSYMEYYKWIEHKFWKMKKKTFLNLSAITIVVKPGVLVYVRFPRVSITITQQRKYWSFKNSGRGRTFLVLLFTRLTPGLLAIHLCLLVFICFVIKQEVWWVFG